MKLEQVNFYECVYGAYWLLVPKGFQGQIDDIEVYVQGDREGPNEKWLAFAYDVLKTHWDNVVALAESRLGVWAKETKKKYVVESVYFGRYPYGPESCAMHGLKITLKTEGNSNEDVYGVYTINYNDILWPIGYEFSIA